MKRLMIGLTMLGLAACGAPAEPTWQLWVRFSPDGPMIESLKKNNPDLPTRWVWLYDKAFQTYQACFEEKERKFTRDLSKGQRLERRTNKSATITGPEGSFSYELACVPSDSWWVWWQEVQHQWARR